MIDGLARIGKVIDHAIDKFIGLILETRKGYNQTLFLFTPSGDDSVPCKTDKVIILKVDGNGNFKGLGVLTESQGANPGEKIFFARDQKTNIVLKIKMLNSGDYSFNNVDETTGEATGHYSKKIKGNFYKEILENSETIIHKDKSTTIHGEETAEIDKSRTTTIHENETKEIDGDETTTTGGDASWGIDGNLDITVLGNINITAQGTVKINGATIHWNEG